MMQMSIDLLDASTPPQRGNRSCWLQFGVLSLLLLYFGPAGRFVAHKLLVVAIMDSDRWFNDLIEAALANHCTANLGGHAAAERASYAGTCDLQ